MRLGTALIVLVAAGGFGCTDPAEPSIDWAPDVDGRWSWTRSTRDADGLDLTPATEGHTAVLALTPAAPGATEGSYSYSEDGMVISMGTYGIAYEDAPGNNFVFWQPAFGGYHELTWVGLAGDTLRLDDAAISGYTSWWARTAHLD